MKLALVWSYYNNYLDQLYKNNPNLVNLSYRAQQDFIIADYFGWPPALAKRLVDFGYEVEIIIVNAKFLQESWAKENKIDFSEKKWQFEIPFEQVKNFNPDVIWIGSMFQYYGEFLNSLRPYCKKIFAWIACPVANNVDLSSVNCILTSHQNFQEFFIDQGKACEILLPAFEPKILLSLPNDNQDIECSFIGSLSYLHLQRIQILNELSIKTPVEIWSDLPSLISKGIFSLTFIKNYFTMRSVRSKINPSVWGMKMYEILAKSKMSINVHVDIASGLAGNMRMFEATGVGTLLITEDAPNIRDLYEPDTEVITYKDTNHLVEIVSYYVDHPEECIVISKAGQRKTLNTHSTICRSEELIALVNKYTR
jgi:spore maturation protein CgeB